MVVKWLRDPAPPPHRGAQLLSHLAAVGFAEMPAFFGVEEVAGRIVAIVTSYVAASQDGWQWYVADLTADLDAGDADAVDRHGAAARDDRRAVARGVGDAVDGDRRSGAPRHARRRGVRGDRLLDEARRLATDAAGGVAGDARRPDRRRPRRPR